MNYQDFVSPKTQYYQLAGVLQLESGARLAGVQVAYRTWGQLNDRGDNGVLVCHALTGWADVEDWWEPLLGPGRALDPERDFIISSNILGSCYGTTGPSSVNPLTGQSYGATFPQITIRDIVSVQKLLLASLGVQSLALAIGGSLGGMQVLEWAVLYPQLVQKLAVIAASGRHSPWAIGLSEAQRQAIYADPYWQAGAYLPQQPPRQGLAAARMMAMNTYRSWHSFTNRFGRDQDAVTSSFAIVQYLRYQGEKLVDRFDANSYVCLTYAMDSHDLGRSRGAYSAVLEAISQPTLVVAIDSDILYPPIEQQELAQHIPQANLVWLSSPHGHDAFLIDMDALNELVLKLRDSV